MIDTLALSARKAPPQDDPSVTTTPILAVHNLVKRYGATVAVDDVSLTIEAGEIFGLLGPNGAGKTTMIGMLCGLFPPTSGTATVGGYDLVRQSGQVKRLIGVVPQDLAIYPTLGPYDNLSFFGSMYGLRGAMLKQRIKEALDIVGLSDKAHQAIGSFSGGMKRRVNIAAGLLHHPKLLFLDEPTVGVDPQSRYHIFESVERLNREYGMTVVYTSHYMEEVEALCKRIAIVDQGKLVALDTKENLVGRLGGGILYIGLNNATPDIVGRLEALPAVRHVEVAETAGAIATDDAGAILLKCQTTNAQRALLSVIPVVAELGLHLTSLEIAAPNLESVFLHLTGKKLRD